MSTVSSLQKTSQNISCSLFESIAHVSHYSIAANAANASVGSLVVVGAEPVCCDPLRLLDGFKDVAVQPLTVDGAAIALDIRVLLRLVGQDAQGCSGIHGAPPSGAFPTFAVTPHDVAAQ